MGKKTSHFGAGGQLAAMGEFLVLGYNVAIPQVDVGEDVLVIDDRDGNLRRVQVKAAVPSKPTSKGNYRAAFGFPREQLEAAQRKVMLFFMLMLRKASGWDFLCVPQPLLKEAFAAAIAAGDVTGEGDKVTLQLSVKGDGSVTAWGTSLTTLFNSWDPDLWKPIVEGPGARGRRKPKTPPAASDEPTAMVSPKRKKKSPPTP